MRLATYQPKIPNEENASEYTKLFRDYLGYTPVWCIPAEIPEQFIFGTWYASPSYPETVISINTDRYVPFDLVKWNQIMHKKELHPGDLKTCFQNVDPKYAEYIVPDDMILDNDDDVIDSIIINDLPEIAHQSHMNMQSDVFEETGTQWFDLMKDYIDNMMSNEEVPVYDDTGKRLTDPALELNAKLNRINMAGGYIFYDIAFHDLFALPFILDPVLPMGGYLSSMESVHAEAHENMMAFYDYAEKATYETFDRICFLFEELIEARSRYVCEHKMHVGRNDLCPCMNGKKFKKCHGGKISIRPDHI